jgi:hypothetical protein
MRFRLRLFSIHLLISSFLALIAMMLVYLVWYSNSLSLALGVTTIFLILLGVDTVLGPLLTLLVAKEGKKTLKFDLRAPPEIQEFC